MFKIIKLTGIHRYFTGFDCGIITTVPSPLEAKKFTPREVWHEEEELNNVLHILEEDGIKYEIYVLNYSIEKY